MRVRFCSIAALVGLLLIAGWCEAGVFRHRAARHRSACNPCQLTCAVSCRQPETDQSVPPAPAATAMALGDSLLEKCDFGGAIAAYNKAIGFDPNCAKAYCERGRAYASKDDFDRAFADWSTAARLDPNYAYPHACLGAAYAKA